MWHADRKPAVHRNRMLNFPEQSALEQISGGVAGFSFSPCSKHLGASDMA